MSLGAVFAVEMLMRSCFSTNWLTESLMRQITVDTAYSSSWIIGRCSSGWKPCDLLSCTMYLYCPRNALLYVCYVVPFDGSCFQGEPSCASRCLRVFIQSDISSLVHRNALKWVVVRHLHRKLACFEGFIYTRILLWKICRLSIVWGHAPGIV